MVSWRHISAKKEKIKNKEEETLLKKKQTYHLLILIPKITHIPFLWKKEQLYFRTSSFSLEQQPALSDALTFSPALPRPPPDSHPRRNPSDPVTVQIWSVVVQLSHAGSQRAKSGWQIFCFISMPLRRYAPQAPPLTIVFINCIHLHSRLAPVRHLNLPTSDLQYTIQILQLVWSF